jgi:hypothetical protein
VFPDDLVESLYTGTCPFFSVSTNDSMETVLTHLDKVATQCAPHGVGWEEILVFKEILFVKKEVCFRCSSSSCPLPQYRKNARTYGDKFDNDIALRNLWGALVPPDLDHRDLGRGVDLRCEPLGLVLKSQEQKQNLSIKKDTNKKKTVGKPEGRSRCVRTGPRPPQEPDLLGGPMGRHDESKA